MSKRATGGIWMGCVILGMALGFILSFFTSYSVGMPIGTMVGVGIAYLFNGIKGR
jgi:hypothetical protein